MALSKSERKKIRLRLKARAMLMVGKIECGICGENHIECLSIDHSNGDGAKHRREIFGEIQNYSLARKIGNTGAGEQFYSWLIKQPLQNIPDMHLRILCMNCNVSSHNYGYAYNKNGDRVYRNPALLDEDISRFKEFA